MMIRSLAIAFATLCATPSLAAPAAIQVNGAWCRPTPVGAPAGACYLTLTAAADDRLVAVETPAATRGEIHTMSMTGGVMRMRKLADGLALPAGKPVVLKPGAEHLMIIGPKQPLAAGKTASLTLRFAKAPPLTIQVPVRAPAMGAAQGMGHH